MDSKISISRIMVVFLFVLGMSQVSADNIKLNSPQVLGTLKLNNAQLTSIKSAVEKAMNSLVDEEQQCGPVRLDCVVRAAREWRYDGVTYREIVINLHTIGSASVTAAKTKGKWPEVDIK